MTKGIMTTQRKQGVLALFAAASLLAGGVATSMTGVAHADPPQSTQTTQAPNQDQPDWAWAKDFLASYDGDMGKQAPLKNYGFGSTENKKILDTLSKNSHAVAQYAATKNFDKNTASPIEAKMFVGDLAFRLMMGNDTEKMIRTDEYKSAKEPNYLTLEGALSAYEKTLEKNEGALPRTLLSEGQEVTIQGVVSDIKNGSYSDTQPNQWITRAVAIVVAGDDFPATITATEDLINASGTETETETPEPSGSKEPTGSAEPRDRNTDDPDFFNVGSEPQLIDKEMTLTITDPETGEKKDISSEDYDFWVSTAAVTGQDWNIRSAPSLDAERTEMVSEGTTVARIGAMPKDGADPLPALAISNTKKGTVLNGDGQYCYEMNDGSQSSRKAGAWVSIVTPDKPGVVSFIALPAFQDEAQQGEMSGGGDPSGDIAKCD